MHLPKISAAPGEQRGARPAEKGGPGHWEGMGFRPDIQGLRAIAVGLVLLSHAGFTFFAGGYIGVDVFFVLSGFLITSLLIKEVFDTGRISIAGFYARRARRILPAASAVVVFTVIASWLWFPVTRIEAVMQDAIAVVLYYVNYRFVSESTEYLNADQMPSPFQQYWSLAVEEQFYVVWPLLLIALLFIVGRSPRHFLGTAIGFSIAIFAGTLALSVMVTAESQPTAYYAAHTRAWELAGGAFLALTLPMWKKLPRAAAWVLAVAGVGGIVASALLYTEATPFPGYTALLPVLGTMAVIAAGTSKRGGNPVSSLLSTAPFQFVGKISYSLYLWHWPILILAPLALDVDATKKMNLLLIVGTFAAAQLSYQYIEEPFRNAGLLKRKHRWGLLSGGALMAACLALVFAMNTAFIKPATENQDVDLAGVDAVESSSELEERLRDGLEVDSVPDDITPPLANIDADRPVTYSAGCHLDFEVVELPDGCVYGDEDADKQVVLIGDSHSAQWFPALDAIGKEQGFSLLSRTKSSCTAVSVHIQSSYNDDEYTECWDWKQEVFDEIDELQPDLVVVGSSDAVTVMGEEGEGAQQAWKEGWTETLDRVSASAANVVTLTDTPWATGEAAPDCLSLNPDSVKECVSGDPYALAHTDMREAGLEAQEEAGVEVIDTAEWFCVDGKCPLIVDGMGVYRDKHHISTPYVVSLSALLTERLPKL